MASVTLSKPIQIFGKTVGSVELKEPNGGQFVRLGEPRILVFNAEWQRLLDRKCARRSGLTLSC